MELVIRQWARIRVPESVGYPLVLFAMTRVWLWVWAAVIVSIFPPPDPASVARTGSLVFPITSSGLGRLLLDPWNRWDTNWYLQIAVLGYRANDGSIAFFPLYPFLIRVVGSVLGEQWLLAALLISNLAALGSLILLYRMVSRLFTEDIARRTLLYVVAFPTGFFLFAGYNESLFLFFALLAISSAQGQRWARAGLATGLAMLTRAQGLVFIVPLIAEFIAQFRQGRARVHDLAVMVAASVIGSAYWFYLYLLFGDAGAWSRSMAYWRANGFLGESIVATIRQISTGSGFAIANNLIDLLAALFFVTFVIWGAFHLPPTLSVYSAAMILPPLLSVQTLVPMLPLASLPRYGIVLFPVFITLALCARPRAQALIMIVSLVLQALFAALFVEWVWIA